MHNSFQGKFHAPTFFFYWITFEVYFFVKKFKSRESSMANFHFQQTTGSITVLLNSSCSWKSTILTFTSTVNTFLPSTNNGGKSTNPDVIVEYYWTA